MGWVAILVVAGLLTGWALHSILSRPADVLDDKAYTIVTAEVGTVRQTLRLNVSAEWRAENTLSNQAIGIVTGLDVVESDLVDQGARLYSVDLRPITLASGDIPAFRNLSQGARGADVEQLQRMLHALGHNVGTIDGVFDAGVASAVRAWQRSLGLSPTGIVLQGDVIYAPSLPRRVSLATTLTVGAKLVGGEPAVQILPDTPAFRIVLADQQARLVAVGMTVDIYSDEPNPWRAVITSIAGATESSGPVAQLGSVDGTPICLDQCARVSSGQPLLLSGLVNVVPETKGVTVPLAAIVTTASGDTAVVLESGELQQVVAVVSASGVAVVEGLEAGTRIRVQVTNGG